MADSKVSNVISVDSAYTVKQPSGIIIVDASKSAIPIFLPSLHTVTPKECLTIRKHDLSTYPVTLIGHGTKIGSDHIWVMKNSKEMRFVFTGDNWVPQNA